MKYSILATALSLALGGGVAIADEAQQPKNPPKESEAPAPAAPAAPAATGEEASNVQSVELFFDTSSAQLSEGASADLKKLATWARCNPKAAIILEGHADPRGTQTYNVRLSGERAAAVRLKLIAMGVPSERIVVTVYGENGPKRPTFAQDRRVTARAVTRPITPKDLSA
jgi:outer membrane protein OmpA-like peptidoglycan-associated protein